MQKIFLLVASIQGGLSVVLGAFGAHYFKNYLTEINRLEVYETAVKYQFYHTFALLAVGIIQLQKNNVLLGYSGYGFIVGSIIFSGSLYLLCITNVGLWGAVTPIGGLFLITGWVLLALSILKM